MFQNTVLKARLNCHIKRKKKSMGEEKKTLEKKETKQNRKKADKPAKLLSENCYKKKYGLHMAK